MRVQIFAMVLATKDGEALAPPILHSIRDDVKELALFAHHVGMIVLKQIIGSDLLLLLKETARKEFNIEAYLHDHDMSSSRAEEIHVEFVHLF